MSDVISKEMFRKKMAKLKVPEGFSLEIVESMYGPDRNTKWLEAVLKSDTIEMRFSQPGDGSTNFKHGDGWLTFDRRGVEASFYWQPMWSGDRVKSLNKIVTEQIQRVTDQLKYYETAITIPGIPGGHTVSPDKLALLKARIKQQGSYTFMPSGFGTGYVVSTRPNRLYRSKPASKELETFLGMSPLFIHSLEMD